MARRTHRVNPLSEKLQRSLDVVGGTGGRASVETISAPPEPVVKTIEAAPAVIAATSEPELPAVEAAETYHESEIPKETLAQLHDFLSRKPAIAVPANSLVFDEEQRRDILTLLGTADPESVMRHLHELVGAAVRNPDGTLVSTLRFTAQQLERVASRCAHGETLQQKLQEYCDYGIDVNIGLR